MAQDLDEMMQKARHDVGPIRREKAAVAEKEPEPLVKEEEVNLSPEERRMVEEFAAKIDLHSSNMILQYGAGAQKKMAEFFRDGAGECAHKRPRRSRGNAGKCCIRVENTRRRRGR